MVEAKGGSQSHRAAHNETLKEVVQAKGQPATKPSRKHQSQRATCNKALKELVKAAGKSERQPLALFHVGDKSLSMLRVLHYIVND